MRQRLVGAGLLLLCCLTTALPTGLAGEDAADPYENQHTAWVYPPWKHSWGVVRATQFHLSLFTLGRAEFVNPQGLAAVRLLATDDPERRGDDDEVTVYGVNSGENSIIYNRSMKSIGLFGYDRASRGLLDAPWDVAADRHGRVYVSDSGHRRIVRLRNEGGELRFEVAFGDSGASALELPRGIALTGSGVVVVADAIAGRVVGFDSSGSELWSVGGLEWPSGLAAVDRASPYARPPREYFVVVTGKGRRIEKFSFDGRRLASVDVAEATGLADPVLTHLETDLYHNVVATDSAHARLLKFDPQLTLLASWGQPGSGRSRFTGPTGVAIHRRFGQTFVADQNGAHYLWIGLDLREELEIRAEPDGSLIWIEMWPTERCTALFELVDGEGQTVRHQRRVVHTGRNLIPWQMKQLRSRALEPEQVRVEEPSRPEPGLYTVRIELRPAYSSRKVHALVIHRSLELPGEGLPEK